MPQTNSVFGPAETDLCNKKYSAALRKLIPLSLTYSHDLHFLTLLAQVQAALNDTTALIKTLQVRARISGGHSARLDLMMALYREGRLNEALDVGIELQDAGVPPALYRHLVHLLAKIYLEFSDYEGVREVSDGIENDDVMSWALGCACLGEGDKNEALRYFRESVGLNPSNDRAWVSLSMLHEEMGDRELALANLERALEINPENSTALKLMSKWHPRHMEKSLSVIDKIQYYLDRHGFDEEISLCYVQLLQENHSLATADFELSKLILNNPAKLELYQMKKNLEDQANL